MPIAPKVIITYGLPGSGKTTLSNFINKRVPDSIVLSNDEIRLKLNITPHSGKTYIVYQELIKQCLTSMVLNKYVIIDSTFYRRIYRAMYLKNVRKFRPQTLLLEVSSPLSICKERIENRMNHISGLGVNDIDKFNKVAEVYTSWLPPLNISWITPVSYYNGKIEYRSKNLQSNLYQNQTWRELFKILTTHHENKKN